MFTIEKLKALMMSSKSLRGDAPMTPAALRTIIIEVLDDVNQDELSECQLCKFNFISLICAFDTDDMVGLEHTLTIARTIRPTKSEPS